MTSLQTRNVVRAETKRPFHTFVWNFRNILATLYIKVLSCREKLFQSFWEQKQFRISQHCILQVCISLAQDDQIFLSDVV